LISLIAAVCCQHAAQHANTDMDATTLLSQSGVGASVPVPSPTGPAFRTSWIQFLLSRQRLAKKPVITGKSCREFQGHLRIQVPTVALEKNARKKDKGGKKILLGLPGFSSRPQIVAISDSLCEGEECRLSRAAPLTPEPL